MSIAPANSSEVRRYGIINASLDAIDKLVKKLSSPGVELRFIYEAGPCGFVICLHLRSKGIPCDKAVIDSMRFARSAMGAGPACLSGGHSCDERLH